MKAAFQASRTQRRASSVPSLVRANSDIATVNNNNNVVRQRRRTTTIASKRKVRFIVYIYIYIYISICKIVQLDESCFSLSRVTREKERKEKYRAASKTKSYFIDRRNVSSGAYLVSNISVSVCLELCNELRPLPSGKSQIARDISVRGEEKGNCRKS